MSKRYVYEKSEHGIGDFVYVDLLPQVRRARQFNANVIYALLFALILSYVLVFIPFRAATSEFESLNGINNDLHHELLLTQEEFAGYEINLDLITFEENIDGLANYRVDFNDLLDDVEIEVGNLIDDAKITFISYSAENQQLRVTVALKYSVNFDLLDTAFEGLPWVLSSEAPVNYEILGSSVLKVKTYTLEVNPNAQPQD
jgi:hypothetical protein